VGKCEVFCQPGDWVFASYLIRVRLRSDEVLPQFASDFLNTASGRLQIDRLSRQIIGMTNINAEEIKEILLPVPSPQRQRELVDAMDSARAARRQNLEQADALLSGLDDFLIETLGLTLPPEDNRRVFAVRSNSATTRFDPHFHAPEFVKIQQMLAETAPEPLGKIAIFSKETWNPLDHREPTFRYIEISGVNPKTGEASWSIVPTGEAPSRARMLIRTDDIIVSLTRPHHGSIAHLSEKFRGCVASTGFAVIRSVAERVRRDYLWCVLRSRFCLRQMLQRTSGGNYPAITEPELAKILVPVPTPEIQAAIASEVNRRRDAANRLRAEAEGRWQAAKLWFEEELLGALPKL